MAIDTAYDTSKQVGYIKRLKLVVSTFGMSNCVELVVLVVRGRGVNLPMVSYSKHGFHWLHRTRSAYAFVQCVRMSVSGIEGTVLGGVGCPLDRQDHSDRLRPGLQCYLSWTPPVVTPGVNLGCGWLIQWHAIVHAVTQ